MPEPALILALTPAVVSAAIVMLAVAMICPSAPKSKEKK